MVSLPRYYAWSEILHSSDLDTAQNNCGSSFLQEVPLPETSYSIVEVLRVLRYGNAFQVEWQWFVQTLCKLPQPDDEISVADLNVLEIKDTLLTQLLWGCTSYLRRLCFHTLENSSRLYTLISPPKCDLSWILLEVYYDFPFSLLLLNSI